jgi:hypothetical protein
MAITQCTADTSAVSNLPDAPALTPAELKATFDKAGTEIKNYINNTMIGDITSTISSTATALNTTINTKDTQYNARMTTIENNVSSISTNMQKVISSGTTTPSGGTDGDIYIQYF